MFPQELLVLVLAVATLALVLRWAFGGNARPKRRDFGLLREVAKARTPTAARAVEEKLRTAGVRATTVTDDEGALRIMVFAADEQSAIALLLADD